MTARRIISTSVILSLLLALMLPVGMHAHGCHGDDAVAQPASRSDEHHHDGDNRGGDHDGEHHSGDHHAGDTGDHHDGVRNSGAHDHGSTRRDGRQAAPATAVDADETASARHPVFCCTEGRETIVERVDAASLPAPLQPTFAVASAAPSGMLPLDVLAGPRIVDDYKIGSSPPGSAAIDRYTYLRISVLLV